VTIWQALILGLLQGLTEFLPVSSSGHLVLAQQWFGLQESILTFDVFIHLATLIAILVFFGKSLFKVTMREWAMVGIGTIPAVFVGLIFKDQIESLFQADMFIGAELILTGLINLYADRQLDLTQKRQEPAPAKALTPKNSFLIGIAQAVAIIPGISRSGSTVAGAISLGLDRETAFRFSFLLAIPALLGAGILQGKDLMETGVTQIDPVIFGVGGLAALGAGLASLYAFKYVITKAKLDLFGWYCIGLGALALVFIH
jgi:undecaprenyl-diphosphatase